VSELGELSHSRLEDLPWAVIERDWGSYEMKLVRCSPVRNTYTNLVRWPAGLVLPKHLHMSGVHSYTFRGSWRYREHGWVATPGSYVYEPNGTVHTLEVLDDVEALFVVEGSMIWYGPDDALAKYQDASDILEDVTKGLAARGVELPSIVVQD
jgi:hypothetical protein